MRSEENETRPSKDRLRALQLDMRLREVYEAYHSFKRLVSGLDDGRTIVANGKADEGLVSSFMESVKGQVDLDNVNLTGHSFGGGTMVSTVPLSPFQFWKTQYLRSTTAPSSPISTTGRPFLTAHSGQTMRSSRPLGRALTHTCPFST